MSYCYRDIYNLRPCDRTLSPQLLSFYTGKTSLNWNEELWQYDCEDGRVYEIQHTRQMFIDHQHDTYNDFQDWFMDELMADYMDEKS